MKPNDKRLRAYLYENRVSPTPAFSARLDGVCARIRRSEALGKPVRAARQIPLPRRALLALLAAAILLAAFGTAYALYWSSTQRAKDYSQSGQAADDRAALAARSADMLIAGLTFYQSVSGTASADGIAFTLRSVAYDAFDGPTMHVCFDATDEKTGDATRLPDIAFVLRAGGADYPAYSSRDKGDSRYGKTAVARAEDEQNGTYSIWFPGLPGDPADQTPMTLSATLYAYDGRASAEKASGAFRSILFTSCKPSKSRPGARRRSPKRWKASRRRARCGRRPFPRCRTK